MPASKYRIWGLGAPVGQGATGSVHIGVAAIAKKSTAAEPYIVGNEIVCSWLARGLMLPCPPGALLESNSETYFFSMNFNVAGQVLPPAQGAVIVSELPELSWGVTLFDILIMNGDRHPQNISFDRQTKDLQIFDHSHAFVRPVADIDALLNANHAILAIGSHILAIELNTWNGFSTWVARVKSLPDYYIEGTIDAGCKVGIPGGKKNALYDFLRTRRDSIDTLVTNNKGDFPKLPAGNP